MRSLIAASCLLIVGGLSAPTQAAEPQRKALTPNASASNNVDEATRREWISRALGHILGDPEQGSTSGHSGSR